MDSLPATFMRLARHPQPIHDISDRTYQQLSALGCAYTEVTANFAVAGVRATFRLSCDAVTSNQL
jgi:hypothetical protein